MTYFKIRNHVTGSKSTAWGWFAKYIKLRDALKTTGSPECARCVTCGVVSPITAMDAGHGIGGRSGGVLFDESICRAQCIKCNRHGGGEYQAFKMVLVAEHGEDWYERKLQARKHAVKLTDAALKLISNEYRIKYKELCEKE